MFLLQTAKERINDLIVRLLYGINKDSDQQVPYRLMYVHNGVGDK